MSRSSTQLYDSAKLLESPSPTAEADIATLLLHIRGDSAKPMAATRADAIRLLADLREVAKPQLDRYRQEFLAAEAN